MAVHAYSRHVIQKFLEGWSSERVAFPTFVHHLQDGVRAVVGLVKTKVILNAFQNLFTGPIVVGHLTERVNLPNQHTVWPDIALFCEIIVKDRFWGHPTQGDQHVVEAEVLGIVEIVAQTQESDFDFEVLANHAVSRGEVFVHKFLRTEVIHSRGQLLADGEFLTWVQSAAAIIVTWEQKLFQVALKRKSKKIT